MNSWCCAFMMVELAFFLTTTPGYSQSSPTNERSGENSGWRVKSSGDPASQATIRESLTRARMLHEFVHGSLQVMHRDFFRKDEGLKIPSRSLEDVFDGMAENHGIELRWIAVNATPMSVDHVAEDDFEKAAVKAIKSGEEEYGAVVDERYRFAGRIPLTATCLSCHASRRSNNDERSAALIISMPLTKGEAE